MSWTAELLNGALDRWNETLDMIWELLTQSPDEFKGGAVWGTIVNINGAVQAIGYALLVLFFCLGICRSTINFRDFRRPEYALRHFIYFVAAKAAITYGMELMEAVFEIGAGIVNTVMSRLGGMSGASATMPQEILDAINDVGFLDSIPLWLVSLLGTLAITVMSFILILVVYGRFFKIYIYTAMSPLALATFGGESTSSVGKTFLKSYAGLCLEGVVIVLSCVIFSAVASTTPSVGGGDAVSMVWSYLQDVDFYMVMLTVMIFTSNAVVKEMFGL